MNYYPKAGDKIQRKTAGMWMPHGDMSPLTITKVTDTHFFCEYLSRTGASRKGAELKFKHGDYQIQLDERFPG